MILDQRQACGTGSAVTGSRRAETGQLAGPAERYTYDPLDQLVQVDQDLVPAETFTYDAAGNRTSDLAGTPYAYDALMNRLTQYGAWAVTHDAAGNRTAGPPLRAGFASAAYTWDARNELVAAQLTGGAEAETVQYRYDALGRRIGRAHAVGVNPATTDTFVYDGLDLLAQYRDGTVYQEYVHGPGLDTPWALVDHSGGGAAAYYYHADRLGSIRALTDATQAVAQSYAYTSYGVTTVTNPGGLDQPFQYTAREWDASSGLYYYRARYYDPAAGRFLSHDPIRHKGGYNLYAYVEGNPLNLIDPQGLLADDSCCTDASDWELAASRSVLIGWPWKYCECDWKCLKTNTIRTVLTGSLLRRVSCSSVCPGTRPA